MRVMLPLWLCAGAALAGAPQEQVQEDSLSSGLTTISMMDEDPPGFRVSWIKWDSGFRGTDLRIGDRIIGVNGKRIEKAKDLRELQKISQTAIGTYNEAAAWKAAGAKDGAPLTLTVRRRGPKEGLQVVEVRGVLRSARTYLDAAGKEILGSGGPQRMLSDNFDRVWSGWYEKFIDRASRALDTAWSSTTSTRYEFDQCKADKPRIDYLVGHYPGPFTDTTKADWERLCSWLQGTAYNITDKDLEFRTLVDRRIAQVATAAGVARDALMRATAANRIEAFPAIDPIRGDRTKVVNKILALPPITNREWVMNSGRCFLTSGSKKQGGFYFADCMNPSTLKMLDAVDRYRRAVSPSIPETYALVARVTDQAKMLVINGVAVSGMLIEIQGAMVGDKMFVDLTDKSGKFAGEAQLLGGNTPPPSDKATPVQVMEAFIAAAKDGREEPWRALFAPWRAVRSGDWASYMPIYKRRQGREWVDTRSLLLSRVADVRIVYVGDVQRILTGKELPKAPVVDQVALEVDHVGKFDDGYRAFNTVAVHRQWLLQRVDSGPWRIATIQGL